ncbi:MAG TPA: hypothetical protein VK508_02745 [Cyclobacteriaceae bacterium]|nr:hypothetical protein [Cyclobacteriaceae bacterium]
MKITLLTAIVTLSVTVCIAQSTYYDVTAGNGNGVRFWQDNTYKIHMGTGSEYQFGPVTDYSIKNNMSGDTGRGWTWGIHGQVPIAAINTIGNMQIAGAFYTGGNIGIGTTSISNPQGWGRVLEVSGTAHSKILATNSDAAYSVGLFSHSGWSGLSGGFVGTETNHNLYFLSNYTPKAVLTTAGRFGIGTFTPQQMLDVSGIVAINGVKVINTTNSLNGQDIYLNGRVIRNESTVNQDGMYINYDATGGGGAHVRFYANGQTERMRIDASTGNVGIGTLSPDAKLAVKGKIHAQEVQIDLAGAVAPDYVFEQNYKLPSLETLRTYIEQYHHLPEVPSAEEMGENGVNVGEMNLLLLKKIEELTLYVIDQQKQIDELKTKVN